MGNFREEPVRAMAPVGNFREEPVRAMAPVDIFKEPDCRSGKRRKAKGKQKKCIKTIHVLNII